MSALKGRCQGDDDDDDDDGSDKECLTAHGQNVSCIDSFVYFIRIPKDRE